MNKPDNPFTDMDFSRFFVDPGDNAANFEALLASQKRNVEALVSAGQVVAEGYQAVARRQLESVQQAMNSAREGLGAAGTDGDVTAQLKRQSTLLQSGIEQAIRNLQESSALIHKSQTEALDILGRRVAEGIDEIKDRSGS